MNKYYYKLFCDSELVISNFFMVISMVEVQASTRRLSVSCWQFLSLPSISAKRKMTSEVTEKGGGRGGDGKKKYALHVAQNVQCYISQYVAQ